LLPSAKCTRSLFQGRTGCGGSPSGRHDIVTCQHLVNYNVTVRPFWGKLTLKLAASGALQEVENLSGKSLKCKYKIVNLTSFEPFDL